MTPATVMIMGVSGSGKSTVGRRLAEVLGRPWVDADDLHPPENIALMSAGVPLTDEHRAPWLREVAKVARTRSPIIGCSALKRVYRDLVRSEAGPVLLMHLTGSRELLAERCEGRAGHFMPLSLLDSQLSTLEPLGADEDGIVLDISMPVEELVDQTVEWMTSLTPHAPRPTSVGG